jgi:transcription-repair coupling factor (superfamily II helicase)
MNAPERRCNSSDGKAQGLPSLGVGAGAEWFARIADSPHLRDLINHIRTGGPCAARGVVGSSATITAAAIAHETNHPVLLVVAHLDEADEALDELESLGFDAEKFPAIEYAAGESGVNVELLAERLALVHRLMNGETPRIIIAPIQSLMQHVPNGRRRCRTSCESSSRA